MGKLHNLVDNEMVVRVGLGQQQRIEAVEQCRTDCRTLLAAAGPLLVYAAKIMANPADLI